MLVRPSHITWAVLSFLLYVQSSLAQTRLPAGNISNQDWNFDVAHRCRILAHRSVIVKNDQHHLLVIDGGFGKFLTQYQGAEVEVIDLNPYTIAYDLSKGFTTRSPDLDPLWQFKKPISGAGAAPVLNVHGMFASSDGNSIWIQGGHYYAAPPWNTSSYYVPKQNIPKWQLWKFDVSNHASGWTDVTNSVKGHADPLRTFAGAASSVTGVGKSFWLGGVEDYTTSSTTPINSSQSTGQFLVFDEVSNSITVDQYYAPPVTDGYWQGNLVHLPIGTGGGWLISLMSLEHAINTPLADTDGVSGNFEAGTPVSLEHIPIYDVDSATWFNQETTWFLSEIPAPRTRFCTALFQDVKNGRWDLWVHGGQLLSDQSQGVEDIYVLSMPSFTWSVVQTSAAELNLIRSHTCHAVGGNLIITGGAPPGVTENTNVTCDNEFVRVLTIRDPLPVWGGVYDPNATYTTPASITEVLGSRSSPIGGFINDKLGADFIATSSIPTPSPSSTPVPTHKSKTPVGAIVGGVVGGVMVVIAIVAWIFLWPRYNARRSRRTAEIDQGDGSPRSPPNGQPELVKDVHMSHNAMGSHGAGFVNVREVRGGRRNDGRTPEGTGGGIGEELESGRPMNNHHPRELE